MEVRRDLFSKCLFLLLGASLALTACGRKEGIQSPQESFFSQEKGLPETTSESPTDSNPTAPGQSPKQSVIPRSLEKYITRLKRGQDLPLVAGRIDIRDVDVSSIPTERLGGQNYRFLCHATQSLDAQDVLLNSDQALLIKRDGDGGDSLRNDFEFVLIRCRPSK